MTFWKAEIVGDEIVTKALDFVPYHIERGGIYLKDAAVYAGMGCIVRKYVGYKLRLSGQGMSY